MKVQTRLSLFSSVVFGIIFIITSLLIYALYYKSAKQNIYNNLKKISMISGIFYLEEDEMDKYEFAKAKAQFNEFALNSDYQIYNEKDSISYGTKSISVPTAYLNEIRTKRHLMFADNNHYCYGIFYEDNQGDFVVIAREKKEELYNQLSTLLWILIASLLLGILAIIILSKWMANVAYRPFRNVINQVNNISTNNLSVEIESPNTKDELQDLIETFNKLLSKISETFIIQKNFVSYVSHEFKTPLASMLGNLEVFSIKDRTPEEYKNISDKLIQEIHQLEEILNTLIILSDLRKSSEAIFSFRLDELIWQIISKLTERYPNSKIKVDIDILPEDEQLLNVNKDRTQLYMALFNIIENAVKYSQGNPINICIFKENNVLCLSVADKGIGIPTNQLKDISKPFYRADNSDKIQGNGLGLSISLRILEKNNIEYSIDSEVNLGTNIIVMFNEKNLN